MSVKKSTNMLCLADFLSVNACALVCFHLCPECANRDHATGFDVYTMTCMLSQQLLEHFADSYYVLSEQHRQPHFQAFLHDMLTSAHAAPSEVPVIVIARESVTILDQAAGGSISNLVLFADPSWYSRCRRCFLHQCRCHSQGFASSTSKKSLKRRAPQEQAPGRKKQKSWRG